MITYRVPEVAEVLEDAADYLEVHGWCQHTVQDQQGRACVLGAINIASGGHTLGVGTCATLAVTRYLGDRRRPEYVPVWNDMAGRTGDEAIDLLKHTAKALRNGEIALDEPKATERRFYDACQLLIQLNAQ